MEILRPVILKSQFEIVDLLFRLFVGGPFAYQLVYADRPLLALDPHPIYQTTEKGIADRASYVGQDVPLLQYLLRLEKIGENPEDYESIWYYY